MNQDSSYVKLYSEVMEEREKRYLQRQRYRFRDTANMLKKQELENKEVLDVGVGSGLCLQ